MEEKNGNFLKKFFALKLTSFRDFFLNCQRRTLNIRNISSPNNELIQNKYLL